MITRKTPAVQLPQMRYLPLRAGVLTQVTHIAHLLYYSQARSSGIDQPLDFMYLYAATQQMYERMAEELLGYLAEVSQ